MASSPRPIPSAAPAGGPHRPSVQQPPTSSVLLDLKKLCSSRLATCANLALANGGRLGLGHIRLGVGHGGAASTGVRSPDHQMAKRPQRLVGPPAQHQGDIGAPRGERSYSSPASTSASSTSFP